MVDEVPKNLNSQEQEQIHGEHYSKHGTKRKQHCSVFFPLETKLTNEASSHSRFLKSICLSKRLLWGCIMT